MKEQEKIRLYGLRPVRVWNRVITYRDGTEQETVYQQELRWCEYNSKGEIVAKGTEDFSNERYDTLRRLRICTWDGTRFDKGGNRMFDVRMETIIRPEDRRKLTDLAKLLYPTAQAIEIR